MSKPRETLERTDRLLASTRDPWTISYGGQARGIALRELGHVRAAVRQLRSTMALARTVDAVLAADVAASLAVTLVVAGRGASALEDLDSALSEVSGADAARIRVRRGSLLGALGKPIEAAQEFRAAARMLHRTGDQLWEARALINLSMALVEVGDTDGAERALEAAENLPNAELDGYESAMIRQNRGLVATLEGRIPAALAHYDVAARRMTTLGTQSAELSEAKSAALLAAGMKRDALHTAEEAVRALQRSGESRAFLANALVRAAEAAVAAEQWEAAREYAMHALRLFRRQGRERGATLARIVAARARQGGGDSSRRLLREIDVVASDAARHRMPEAIEANLLAGEVALALGDRETAGKHLTRAKRARTRRSDLGKVLGWRAAALSAQSAGRRASVLKACGAGLDILEGHQATLGAIEMRAAATAHGLPLARMAVRATVESGDARVILEWVERWRSTTLRLPPVDLPDDPELASALARLRLTRLRLDEATTENPDAAGLEREVADLEAAVRDRTRGMSTDGSHTGGRFDVDAALNSLAGAALVEIFELDGRVHVLLAKGTDVRRYVAGSVDEARRAVDFARYSLRRMSHRAFAARAQASLPLQALYLQQVVLGPAADELGDRPVVIVPPARLSSVPWGVLPALRDREVSVAASAASWWSAKHTDPYGERVALVAGPSLAQARAEVDELTARYPYATVLPAGAATAEAVLAAIDGAALAHVAAHGTFRADNPLFSALLLDDGPLTVYDLQRLKRAPHRLVLSCCDSGTVSPAGADEVLGLASALVPLGMAGMIAATVPVSDEAAVPFALGLHDRLRAGASSAAALRDARTSADTPAAYAITHSFTAFGAS